MNSAKNRTFSGFIHNWVANLFMLFAEGEDAHHKNNCIDIGASRRDGAIAEESAVHLSVQRNSKGTQIMPARIAWSTDLESAQEASLRDVLSSS